MPVNPYLLNQAANPGPAPIDSFLPAFRGAQDRRFQKEAFAQENEMRLAEMKMKWQQYVTKQRDTQKAEENQSAFQQEFAAIPPDDPDYGMKVHRLATQYGVDLKGASLIPKPGEAKAPEIATFQVGRQIVQTTVGSPEYERLVADPGAILRNTPSSGDFGEGTDKYVWAAYKSPGSDKVKFGRLTDAEIRGIEAQGGEVMPVGEAPDQVAQYLGGGTAKELADQFVQVNSLIRTGNNILEVANQTPESVGWAGEAVNLGYTLVDNANRMIGMVAPETPKSQFIEENSGLFGSVAADNSELRSLIYDLAYAYMAGRHGQEGRGLSDQDVKFAINIISASTPVALNRNIRRAINETINVYNDRFRALSGGKYEGQFGDFESLSESKPTMDEVVTDQKRRRYNPATGTLE